MKSKKITAGELLKEQERLKYTLARYIEKATRQSAEIKELKKQNGLYKSLYEGAVGNMLWAINRLEPIGEQIKIPLSELRKLSKKRIKVSKDENTEMLTITFCGESAQESEPEA